MIDAATNATRCELCQKPISNKDVVHEHKNGKIRILCSKCAAAIKGLI